MVLGILLPSTLWGITPSLGLARGYRPDPQDFVNRAYKRMQEEHARVSSLTTETGHQLRVVTYNTGLLSKLFAKVPNYVERSPTMPVALLRLFENERPDIVHFQEVFEEIDFRRFDAIARAFALGPVPEQPQPFIKR